MARACTLSPDSPVLCTFLHPVSELVLKPFSLLPKVLKLLVTLSTEQAISAPPIAGYSYRPGFVHRQGGKPNQQCKNSILTFHHLLPLDIWSMADRQIILPVGVVRSGTVTCGPRIVPGRISLACEAADYQKFSKDHQFKILTVRRWRR